MAYSRSGSLLAGALLLAACSGDNNTPGAATPAEARALNDAAAMLDANSVDMNAVSANQIDDGNEEQPQ
ncbi:hypothetical protein NDN01_02240 [Sphingomonas sp. QA11]|uniref:hypothetical protein n=1 Tax=Sphingomonas sp. QA11 TaxID=2950605 RepID=UPI002349E9E4|nr:hypothetical protein [Sphingomonas sp. QA11]WCM27773.1 hypothetical protein NDN01_02240 [Sphingomonas sp. QA11]